MTAKLAPVKFRARGAIAGLAPYGKILGLLLVLYVWLVLGQPREAIPIRVGEFIKSTGLTFEHASVFWLTRTFFVLGSLVLGLVLANAWCRFLCPTGGLLDLVKGVSFAFKFYKTADCNDCDKCLRICDMGTRPGKRTAPAAVTAWEVALWMPSVSAGERIGDEDPEKDSRCPPPLLFQRR